MVRKNRTRNSNDDDLDSNESSDEDGWCSSITVQTISTSNQQQIVRSQSTEEIQSNNAEQSNINQQIFGYPYAHHYVLYYQNHHGVQLGHSDPSNENSTLHYIFASSQNYLPAEYVDYPTDERVRWMNDYQFSSTIEEDFTFFRESECIEDTQAHHMPPIIVLNNIGLNQIANGENNRINMDVITQNNPSEIAVPLRSIDVPAETTVTDNVATRIPDEIPQDTDFSVMTSETQNINGISMGSDDDDDEQSLMPNSFRYVEDNDKLIHSNNEICEASPNNSAIVDIAPTITSSNQMNNVDEQTAGTELTNNTLSPETSEITRDVATNDATSQAIFSITDIPVTSVSKLSTTIEPSDDSNKAIHP